MAARTVGSVQERNAPVDTVLISDNSVALEPVDIDREPSSHTLWIRARDLPRVNGFILKPEGACRGPLCIPVAPDMVRGDAVNLTAFAQSVGQCVVAEPDARIWSIGEMPAQGGDLATSRIAPDFTLPDRLGRPVHLAGFRGKKALVITWASW